ncbi:MULTISPECIES: hypothetical protein [unclassified Pseudoclavibacter]|uniref:hypothetical protein n=1 Tax=unclassified Pseudoclavibacter TaxID=2615177 RepID=UPI0013014D0B|nr:MULTISPECIES: hypothetical protein [unclassified Pseudoclavibacter]KAB1645477.1 hypothetical protein F8O06_07755 [Pseudoclavibacter sp. CFCC 14310]KAB1646064.1 hypothetical protein F8O06_04690 [Pseudoclavibacter sp. CFCC 14310]KAB1663628.1 hypothetical protein F8O08_07855 [Pseudoclavibacter sp. CFCC 13611]KAB1664623.1 hypothetical protein F8O08_04425 [Pseudoclavibacter sp. CFCC 13611]
MKGFATQAAFGAAGNVGVYSVTNAADGKPWTVPGAEVAGGVVEDQLNGTEDDYDMFDAGLDAVGGGLLSKFPDAAKFTAKHVVENLTGANAAAPEPNQGTTDSSHGATQ